MAVQGNFFFFLIHVLIVFPMIFLQFLLFSLKLFIEGEMPQLRKTDDKQWSEEQYLAASAVEQNRLKNEIETSGNNLIGVLSSPFKVAPIPCESFRRDTVKCVENFTKNNLDDLGIQRCIENVRLYNQCTAEVVNKHSALATALAEKNASLIP